MTRIERIFFVIMVALGSVLAGLMYPVGGLRLAIPGFAAGFFLLPGLGVAYELYRRWAGCEDHRMPCCTCGSREFKVKMVRTSFYEICQSCGRRYGRLQDKVFMIEDGSRKPYMQHFKHRGWVKMNSQPGGGAGAI